MDSQQIEKSQKRVTGIVASDKMDKSIVVVLERLVQHRMYGKYVRRNTRCVVHDENNEAREGDQVVIEQTRPMSKRKRWRLVEVLRKA